MHSSSEIQYITKDNFAKILNRLAAYFPHSRAVDRSGQDCRVPVATVNAWFTDFEGWPEQAVIDGCAKLKNGPDFPTFNELIKACKPNPEKYQWDVAVQRYEQKQLQNFELPESEKIAIEQIKADKNRQWILDEIEKHRAAGNTAQVERWQKCFDDTVKFVALADKIFGDKKPSRRTRAVADIVS